MTEAADAMDEVLAAYMQDGLGLPAPSKARRGSAWYRPLPKRRLVIGLEAA